MTPSVRFLRRDRLLFVSDRDGDPDIYVANADGSHVKQLTNHPGYDGGPFFSPDGQWIAYRTDRLEKDLLQIHVMKADGTNDVAITREGEAFIGHRFGTRQNHG